MHLADNVSVDILSRMVMDTGKMNNYTEEARKIITKSEAS